MARLVPCESEGDPDGDSVPPDRPPQNPQNQAIKALNPGEPCHRRCLLGVTLVPAPTMSARVEKLSAAAG